MKTWILLLAIVVMGCTSTVIPKHVQPAVASFDGNAQNSGVVVYLQDGSAVVTQHWVDRYKAMAAVYGKKFTPPLDVNITFRASVTLANPDDTADPGFVATKQQRADFMTMNRWRKEGVPPAP